MKEKLCKGKFLHGFLLVSSLEFFIKVKDEDDEMLCDNLHINYLLFSSYFHFLRYFLLPSIFLTKKRCCNGEDGGVLKANRGIAMGKREIDEMNDRKTHTLSKWDKHEEVLKSIGWLDGCG